MLTIVKGHSDTTHLAYRHVLPHEMVVVQSLCGLTTGLTTSGGTLSCRRCRIAAAEQLRTCLHVLTGIEEQKRLTESTVTFLREVLAGEADA